MVALIGAEPDPNKVTPPVPAPNPAPSPVADPAPALIEVNATRLDRAPADQPFTYTRLEREDIDQQNQRTAVDALDAVPGVFVQRTSTAQASPYLRGLTGYQTLQLFDGVRYNHLMNRSGPNQYAAMIPDVSLGAVDVVLGSGSTVQGSDGLTGTIDWRLAEAGRGTTDPVTPFGKGRFATAEGYTTQGGVDGKLGQFTYTAEGSRSDWAERRGGDESGDRLYGGNRHDRRIPNTDYREYSYAGRVAWTPIPTARTELSAGRSSQLHAPRTDGYYENTNDSSRISRYFSPETFTYLHLRQRLDLPGWLPALALTGWYHRHDETQIRERITGGRYRREEFRDGVTTYGSDLQATGTLNLLGQQTWTWGGTYYRDTSDNGYLRYQTPANVTNPERAGDVTTSALEDQSTTLPDNSRYVGLAGFVQNDWQFDDRWSVLAGLRWSRAHWNAHVRAGRSGFATDQDVRGEADAWTGNLRLGYRVAEPLLTYAGISQGFRAPTLSDLAGSDLVAGGAFTLRANPDLDAERATTYELGAKLDREQDHAGVAVFWTRITDQIQAEYVDSDGNGTIDTYRPTNGERADLRGLEVSWDLGLKLDANLRLAWFQSTSVIDGESRSRNAKGDTVRTNLPRANLAWGRTGLNLSGTDWYALTQVRWSGPYGETSEGQGADPRHYTVRGNVTSSDGTMPGWWVWDVKAGWRKGDHLRIDFAIENLLDATYRQLGSSADATGINAVLTLGVRG